MSDIKSVVEAAMGNGGVVHISNVMGKFKCNKVVSAARISQVIGNDQNDLGLRVNIQHPEFDDMTLPYVIADSMTARYTPQVGDYVVLYEDGYVSASPKEAFESGYRLIRDEQDHLDEEEIESLGLNAPRVTAEQIDELLRGVTFHTYVVPGTTTTIATAIAANGFTLSTGLSGCASPENFNADLGAKYAIRDAESKARQELWKLEGWRLKCQIACDK